MPSKVWWIIGAESTARKTGTGPRHSLMSANKVPLHSSSRAGPKIAAILGRFAGSLRRLAEPGRSQIGRVGLQEQSIDGIRVKRLAQWFRGPPGGQSADPDEAAAFSCPVREALCAVERMKHDRCQARPASNSVISASEASR